MAGRPLRNSMIAALSRRVVETFGDEPKEDGSAYNALDYACVYVENGRTLTMMLAEIELELNGGVVNGPILLGRSMLTKYFDSLGPATELLTIARDAGAHAMVEQGIQKLDDKANETDKTLLQANDRRLQARERLAAVWSRDFRNSKQPGVSITIGSLHLDALKAVNADRPLLPATVKLIEDGE